MCTLGFEDSCYTVPEYGQKVVLDEVESCLSPCMLKPVLKQPLYAKACAQAAYLKQQLVAVPNLKGAYPLQRVCALLTRAWPQTPFPHKAKNNSLLTCYFSVVPGILPIQIGILSPGQIHFQISKLVLFSGHLTAIYTVCARATQ